MYPDGIDDLDIPVPIRGWNDRRTDIPEGHVATGYVIYDDEHPRGIPETIPYGEMETRKKQRMLDREMHQTAAREEEERRRKTISRLDRDERIAAQADYGTRVNTNLNALYPNLNRNEPPIQFEPEPFYLRNAGHEQLLELADAAEQLEIEPNNRQGGMAVDPRFARLTNADNNTNVTVGMLRKYLPNPDYRRAIAKTVRGRKRIGKYRRFRRYRRYRRYGRARRPTYRGRGAYTMDPGMSLGAQWGGYLGSKAGEYLGGAAQGLFATYSGLGDYQIRGNALMPGISNPNPHGGQVFNGCEYLGDVISGPKGTFNNFVLPINPGLEGTFPKLSQFLANYDQYVIEGMYFEYRSMSGDALNSTNTALGQVVMCCDYNVLNPPFASKQMMEEYEGGVSIVPSANAKFFVECARSESPMDILYTRTGTIPANSDLRMYDLGNFQIATNGLQADYVNLGELWVCYQVAGLKSKIYAGLGNYNNALEVYTTGFSNTAPLGTTTYTKNYANPPFYANPVSGTVQPFWSIQTSGTVLTFPLSPLVQTYKMILFWTGTGAVSAGFPTLTYTNCITSAGSYYYAPEGAVTTENMMLTLYVVANVPNNVASIAFSGGGTLPTGTQELTIQIYQVPNLIFGV